MDKKLIPKHQQTNGKGTGVLRRRKFLSSEQEKAAETLLKIRTQTPNTNSNYTVGASARKMGVDATRYRQKQTREQNSKPVGEMYTPVENETHQDPITGEVIVDSYTNSGSNSSGAMSGRDPLLGTAFDWTVGAKGINTLGKTFLWNYAKYVPTSELGRWGRNYFINDAFKRQINNITPILSNNLSQVIRTKLGDIEINNPQLSYRQGNNLIKDLYKSGIVRTPEDINHASRIVDTGKFSFEFGKYFDNPMFAQGRLWYKPGSYPDLLVTSRPLSLATKSSKEVSSKLNGTFDVRGYDTNPLKVGIRRVPSEKNPLTISDVATYRWKPGYGYREVTQEPSTSLKFFERRPSRIREDERVGKTRGERNNIHPFRVAKYPGYQLKSLMGGSPLERQLSKNGTINVNSLMAQVNKASEVEKSVINKVLQEQFAGQKYIDYNALKKAVQEELIGKYNRVPQTGWADYGMERLGFLPKSRLDIDLDPRLERFSDELGPGVRFREDGRLLGSIDSNEPWWFENYPELNTFTFESPRIPTGSNKHYDVTTLGHSRTFTPKDQPKKLYVMESQSDWGQNKVYNNGPYTGTSSYLNDVNNYKEFIERHKRLLAKMKANPSEYREGAIAKQEANIAHHESVLENMLKGPNDLQIRHLHDNYLQRQLQENLRFAAENGQTTVSYATPETAAKIEGYQKNLSIPESERGKWAKLDSEILRLQGEKQQYTIFDKRRVDIDKQINELKDQIHQIEANAKKSYDPKHQTILKKYADFPKLFKKLYKDQEVRTIIDNKGNTWYEVDVPKGYLSREWQYKQGGKMIRKGQNGLEMSNNYSNWVKLPNEQKRKVRSNIAKAYLSSGPSITNFWNAFQAYIGNKDPQNPNMQGGIPPIPGMKDPKKIVTTAKKVYPTASKIVKDVQDEGFLNFVERLATGKVNPNSAIQKVRRTVPEFQAVPRGFVKGNEVTPRPGTVKDAGLTIRRAKPVNNNNYVNNPAERQAALDFLEENPGYLDQNPGAISLTLPTGRPTGDYMYPAETLAKIKAGNSQTVVSDAVQSAKPQVVKTIKKTTSQRQTANIKQQDIDNKVSKRTSDQFKEGAAYATGDARRVHVAGRTYNKADNAQLKEILNGLNKYPPKVQNTIRGFRLREQRMIEKGSPDKKALNLVRRQLREYLRQVRDQYGILKQGGTISLKNGSGIHIKKKNRGKFTEYCGGKVTDSCIRRAKASGNPTLVKRATFAANAGKWKHANGGQLKYQFGGILGNSNNVLTSIYQRQRYNYPGVHLATPTQSYYNDDLIDNPFEDESVIEEAQTVSEKTPFMLEDIDFSAINPYKGNELIIPEMTEEEYNRQYGKSNQSTFKSNSKSGSKQIPKTQEEKAKYLLGRLQNELNLTKEQAAGIVGNIYVESKFNPTAKGDKGKVAHGIAQWHPARRKGINILGMTFEQQVDYLIQELQTEATWNHYGGLNGLRKLTNARDAAAYVDKYFERSSGQARTDRQNYADTVSKLKALKGGKL